MSSERHGSHFASTGFLFSIASLAPTTQQQQQVPVQYFCEAPCEFLNKKIYEAYYVQFFQSRRVKSTFNLHAVNLRLSDWTFTCTGPAGVFVDSPACPAFTCVCIP